MSKALAIDLDGTLLAGEDLSPRNRDAVKRASESGYHIIIATARWRQVGQHIMDQIGIEEVPMIACSGAQVYCIETGRDIFDKRLPIDFVRELYDICNSNRCIATATVNSHTWFRIDPKPEPEYITEAMRWVPALPDPDEAPRIATVQGSGTIALVREMHKDWQDQVNIFDSVGPSGRIVITITARGADKGIALDKTCEHLSIDNESVIAFGDSENDIEMFRRAGRSVAMGQADDELKDAATHVTTANTEDGVALFIENELL